jgi:hypothetical protein
LRAIQVDALAYIPLRENAEQFAAAGVDETHPKEQPESAQITIWLRCQPNDAPEESHIVCWTVVPEAGRWKLDSAHSGACE